MTEEFPADTPPPNPAPDSSDDQACESEVDALLADAAELAAEVSEELAEVQPTINEQNSFEPTAPADLTPEAGDVDAQLAALDALIEQASQEIGRQEPDEESPSHDNANQDDSASTAGSTPQPITESGAATAATDDPSAASLTSDAAEKDLQQAMADIPDFMKEFTEPSAEETSSSSPPSSASDGVAAASSEPDDDVQTVEQEILATGRTRNLTQANTSSNKPATTASAAKGKKTRSRKFALHVPPKLTQVALSVCDRGATALEIIDRPTSRIGDQFRMLAGLAAVATLATAMIVFVISLF